MALDFWDILDFTIPRIFILLNRKRSHIRLQSVHVSDVADIDLRVLLQLDLGLLVIFGAVGFDEIGGFGPS